MAATAKRVHPRRMCWRRRTAYARAATSGRHHQVARQVRDLKRHGNPRLSMPGYSIRRCLYRALMVITMQRHEFRQANWQTAKHHKTGWLGLLVIVLAYCIVGALEQLP